MILGLFFLLLGISILVKVIWKVDLPIIRIAFALFLLYFGFKMLFGSFGSCCRTHIRTTHIKTHDEPSDYNIVFGKGLVDLTQLPPGAQDAQAEVNVVFGDAEVLLDPRIATAIRGSAVFGESRMPDDSMVAFGSLHYRNEAAKKTAPILTVTGNVIFGSMRFKNKE